MVSSLRAQRKASPRQRKAQGLGSTEARDPGGQAGAGAAEAGAVRPQLHLGREARRATPMLKAKVNTCSTFFLSLAVKASSVER